MPNSGLKNRRVYSASIKVFRKIMLDMARAFVYSINGGENEIAYTR